MTSRVQQLITKYELLEHPEGGYFKENFRGSEKITIKGESYFVGTDIYYLLRSYKHFGDFSAWHKLIDIDEIFHHLEGNDLDIHIMNEKGEILIQRLGKSDEALHMVNIPKNTWFSAVVVDTEEIGKEGFTFVSCTCAPGFDYKSFKLADRQELINTFPNQKEEIIRFTRDRG